MSNYKNINSTRLADQFAALGNENRLRLFMSLLECCGDGRETVCDGDESACVGDLADTAGIAPSTVSHHLKELRLAGLIDMKRQGKQIRCRVNRQQINLLIDFLK